MARIRSIKPEFWSSEQIVECSTSARLLFIGLWNFADDGGVHPYSAKSIKMRVFPGDELGDKQVDTWIAELLAADLLRSFSAESKRFLYVTGWHHQKIDRPTFKFPQPNEGTAFDDGSPKARRAFDEALPPDVDTDVDTEGKGGKAADAALPPFPKSVDSPALRKSLSDWLEYKGKRPKARALKALVTRIANRVTAHGEQAVVDAIERAMSQEYKGWDFDEWFAGKCAQPTSKIVTPEEFATMDVDLASGRGLV